MLSYPPRALNQDDTAIAAYITFQVENATTFYRLTVTGYSGTAGDSFGQHDRMSFSTHDGDHDSDSSGNCAVRYVSGWWLDHCHQCQLNGEYFNNVSTPFGRGIQWNAYKGRHTSMKTSIMSVL